MSAIGAAAGAPVPFSLAVAAEPGPAAAGVEGGGGNAGAGGSGAAGAAGQAAGNEGGGAVGAGGGEEVVLSPEEDERQCAECIEVRGWCLGPLAVWEMGIAAWVCGSRGHAMYGV